MSFVPIQCNCLTLKNIEKQGYSMLTKHTKHSLNVMESPLHPAFKINSLCFDEGLSISSEETQDSNSAFSSEEELGRAPLTKAQHFHKNAIVSCIQQSVYGSADFSNIFATQINLVCSDKLCVFKINSDALKKLISGNFIEENGLTIEIKENYEEIQRKRILGDDWNKDECVEMKKTKLSENPGVIGDPSSQLYLRMALDEEKITETETLARITWDASKRCNTHKEPLYFVCETCRKTICSKCIIESHQGHRIVAKNTESAYVTAEKLHVSLSNYIKDIENLLWEVEVILKEIPYYANETADCIMGLLDSWEYKGSCIHRRPYLLKMIDTIKTTKVRDLKLQQQNLHRLLFRTQHILRTIQQSVLSEDASNITYASLTVREELEFVKKFDYGFLPIHNKEFRIALKPKPLKRLAALTILSTSAVDSVKQLALKKIPFQDSERFLKMYKQKIGFSEFKIGSSKDARCFGEEGNDKGQLCRPWGIVCDKNGRFFVSDRSNNRIQVFNPDGSYGFGFGKFGNGKGELNRPAGIAIDIFDRLIVADKDNHRIQIFTLDGDYVLYFGNLGNLPGQFNYPWDVCTNTQGDIVVSDTKNRRIQIFTKYGTLNGIIDFYPYDLKFFNLPRAVKFNIRGELVVGDFNNHRFLIFDHVYSSFKLYGSDGQFNRPQGLFIDSEGNHIVANSKNSCVTIYDKNFRFLKEIKNDMLKNPQGVCLTPNGNIAVVDMVYHRILIL